MKFEDILKKLSEPIPPELIKSRITHGTSESDYLEWTTVADILDRDVPGWSFGIKSVEILGKLAVAIGCLTIEGVSRSGVGVGTTDEKGIKKSEHDALKRAAVKFGIGRELYRKDEQVAHKAADSAQPKPQVQHKVPAVILCKEQREGWKSPALIVEVGEKKFKVIYFLNEHNFSLSTIFRAACPEKLQDASIIYPIECLVTMEKSGKYWNITAFHPKEDK